MGYQRYDTLAGFFEDSSESDIVRTPDNAERLDIRQQISDAGREFFESLRSVADHYLLDIADMFMMLNEEYVLNHSGERETNDTVDILRNGFTTNQKRMIERLRDRLTFPDPTTNVLNIAGSRDEQPVLLCPLCGFIYLHIVSVSVYTGTGIIEISDKGTLVKSERHPSVYRGSVVRITVYCEECGQLINLQLKFHKGQTYIEITAMGTLPEEHPIHDLWRD